MDYERTMTKNFWAAMVVIGIVVLGLIIYLTWSNSRQTIVTDTPSTILDSIDKATTTVPIAEQQAILEKLKSRNNLSSEEIQKTLQGLQ